MDRGEYLISTLLEDGIEGLGASIIMRAFIDIRDRPSQAIGFAESRGYDSLEQEIEIFWTSTWGMFLKDVLGLSTVTLNDLIGG